MHKLDVALGQRVTLDVSRSLSGCYSQSHHWRILPAQGKSILEIGLLVEHILHDRSRYEVVHVTQADLNSQVIIF